MPKNLDYLSCVFFLALILGAGCERQTSAGNPDRVADTANLYQARACEISEIDGELDETCFELGTVTADLGVLGVSSFRLGDCSQTVEGGETQRRCIEGYSEKRSSESGVRKANELQSTLSELGSIETIGYCVSTKPDEMSRAVFSMTLKFLGLVEKVEEYQYPCI